MIIDCHVHLFKSTQIFSEEDLKRRFNWRREWLGDEEFGRWQAAYSGTFEALIKDMNGAGVDKSVVFASGPFWGEPNPEIPVWECNQYIAEAQRRYPERIIGFVRVDLSKPTKETVELLETGITEWGLKGVKIVADRPLGDESCRKVMDKINELNVPVMLHMGVSPTPMPFLFEHGNPEILCPLMLRYPTMRIAVAHCASGYENLLTEIISGRRAGTVFCDLSWWQKDCSKSPWHFLMQMRYFLDKMPNQILMGSDWPGLNEPSVTWGPFGGLSHKEWFDAIKDLKIPDQVLQLGLGIKDFKQEEKNKILGDNARRWLGI